ncbi:hypothetical protein HZC08_00375, partial [Candidatus Micrarchaeota archaeon]|nr:hypothetical protein [Candidatus Micrarchaeota archaeon]
MHDLAGFLLQSFSGELKRKNSTKIIEGKKIFSDKLSIWEDGTMSGSMVRPFDDEGVPSEKRVLVENGIVKNLMYNRETAALEGIERGGFCTRGDYSSRPSVGRANIKIAEGKCK